MSPRTQTLQFDQLVPATPAQVYSAFTNATSLREWLCDGATVSPKVGGRLYLWWNADYYLVGEYTEVTPNKKIAFTWLGRNEPGKTRVQVTLKPRKTGTLVSVKHSGIGTSSKWGNLAEEYRNSWKESLENLAAIFETGRDQRIFNRPMIGISLGDYTAENAEKLGVPVTRGIRLAAVSEGMGAKAAGLQANDVLVSLAGKPLTDFASVPVALQGKKGGDKVEVEFYRGAKKKTVTMELSRRPIPEVPFEPKELAKRVHARYNESLAALAKVFEGVSEAQAAHKPASDEWSAKEVLAHLIQGERFNTLNIYEVMTNFESRADDWGGNSHEAVYAIAASFPTYGAMLGELKLLADETIALIENFPAEYVSRKGSYFRIAWGLLEGQTHTHEHLDQIRAAIAAAK